jgi:2-hydroxychromene-2-carboxylate isomerase
MKRRPRLYFCFRSPYTWLAVRALATAVPDMYDRIDFVPYWEPDPKTYQGLKDRGADFLYAPMTKAKHLYILYDTKRIAQRLGATMRWPVDVDPSWDVPHFAWCRANRSGLGPAFLAEVMAARWERGEDVCDRTVIRDLARRVGADPALADAVDDPDVRDEAVGHLAAAYEDDVFGIPYFFVGRQRFWGFDRLPDFLAALSGGEPPPDLNLAADLRAYDTDVAGGCG